jgi:hypothetical protein
MMDFQYKELILYPLINEDKIEVIREKKGFELSLNVSKAGTIYCAASDASNDYITSTIAIKRMGTKYVNTQDGYNYINIKLKNLIPSTTYIIYCYTEDFSNHRMPFNVALNAKTNSSTTCCASITFTSTFPSIREFVEGASASAVKVFTFALDSFPKQSTTVNIDFVPELSNCRYYDQTTVLTPSEYIVPSSFTFTNQSTSLIGSFLIRGAPGCYNIITYVKKGTPYSNATSTVNILSSKTPPVPPLMTSVQFSNDGRYLYVTFDSSTDKATTVLNGQVSFDCSRILSFNSSFSSKCLWQTEKFILVTLSSTIPVDELPNIGDKITLLDKVIKPLCTMSTDICSQTNATAKMTLPIVGPANPISPSVSMSTPSKIGQCNDIVLDASRSTGKAGRPWKVCKWLVESTISDYLAEISYNISLLQDTNQIFTILKQNLSPGIYTFSLEIKNWMDQSALVQKNVEVTESSAMPVVSIPGPPVISMYKYQPLSVFALAFVSACGGITDSSKITVSYAWTMFKGVQIYSVENKSKDKRYFKLLANSLDPGSYTVQVTVSTSTDSIE